MSKTILNFLLETFLRSEIIVALIGFVGNIIVAFIRKDGGAFHPGFPTKLPSISS